MLIIPKKVIRTLDDATDEDQPCSATCTLVAVKLAKQLGLAKGYRLVMNCNEHGGQTVPHLHVHLLGGRDMHLAAGLTMTDTELRPCWPTASRAVRGRIARCVPPGRARPGRRHARRGHEDRVAARSRRSRPELGVLDLGENRPQELWKKAAAVPAARWHLIGHLQRNKLDRTVPLVTLDALRR